MTTLLCIPLTVLLVSRLVFPFTWLLFFCNVARAAIDTPAVEERKEKLRRKAEENSLTAG